ncbi:MAG TPA: hypothetical protein VK815_17880 [Candidatus Acidoferrales bacterium]|nr:hypothetical protein [Candidatus Acidoferrales bacterium]
MERPTNPTSSAGKKSFTWHLPAILLLALLLRLCYLGWAQGYNLGNQMDSIEAYEVAASYDAGDERAQYLGEPNYNDHSKVPGPLWTLFCLAGIRLTGSLDGLVVLIILGNVAAIALTWRLTRDVAGVVAANFAALFMAVSVWAVQCSAILWNPSLMPLCGAVIYLALYRCLRKPKSRAVFLIPFLILAGAQVHMATIALIVPMVAFGWLARLKPNWRWLAAGIVAGGLCYVPYLLGEMRHDWANTRAVFVGGGHFSAGALKIFSSPFSFIINLWNPGWTYAPGEYKALAHQAFGGMAGMIAVNAISAVFAILLVLGAGLAVRAAMKNRGVPLRESLAQPGLLPVLFILLAYLGFSLASGRQFHARYCLLILPLIFTLAGCGAAKCLEPGFKKFFLPVLVVTMAADIWLVAVICHFERDRIANSVAFVPSWGKMESVYQQLKTHAPGWIEVDDRDYMAKLPTGEENKVYRHAYLISHYIRARELELLATGTTFPQTNYFELRAVKLVDTNDPAVAFHGNGIALVAGPGPVQR